MDKIKNADSIQRNLFGENHYVYIHVPKFTGRNVPCEEIAQFSGKSTMFIRYGLREGFLKFGVATRYPDSEQWLYYCPDKKVWEETGYFRDVENDGGKK